jgi:hypothetical protein
VDGFSTDTETVSRQIDLQGLATGNTGFPKSSGDDGGVTCHAAVARQNSLRGEQPMDVIGSGLRANENDRLAVFAELLCLVGIEDDAPHCRSG